MMQNKKLRGVVAALKKIEQTRGKEAAAEMGYLILQILAADPKEQRKLIYQYFDGLDKKISKLEEMTDYANKN